MKFAYTKDHPVFEGHFQDQPVIPGAVILTEVVEAATKTWPNRRVKGIASAKFFYPLGPETEVDLHFRETDQGLRFVVKNASTTFAEGLLILAGDGY